MTIGKVVDHFIIEYNSAMNNPYVRRPISYALYQTWKWSEKIEKPRKDQK